MIAISSDNKRTPKKKIIRAKNRLNNLDVIFTVLLINRFIHSSYGLKMLNKK